MSLTKIQIDIPYNHRLLLEPKKAAQLMQLISEAASLHEEYNEPSIFSSANKVTLRVETIADSDLADIKTAQVLHVNKEVA